ncbi:major facilitator superfamily domain-containing protein [Aspergillus desertorum]
MTSATLASDVERAEKGGHGPTENRSEKVDWDGPDDPANPMNWSTGKKAAQLVLMAANTFITPLASSMFAPGIQGVMTEFHSTDTMLASFVVSVFILGYVVGPLHACNVLFLVLTVACAVAKTLSQLIVFRLAGVAGVCPITIGSGTIADMIPQEKRAGIMAVWALGPILGPVVGPVAGGFLAEAESWRWVFWVIAITTGVIYRESYAPVLLARKAAQLRKETGDPSLRSVHDTGRTPKQIFVDAFTRPIKFLFLSPIVFLFSLFSTISYGYLYLMLTTITSIFEGQYGWTPSIAGLAYLGFGIGTDHTAKGIFKPESRLPPMIFGSLAIPIGLFWYGWSAEAQTHWIVPIIGTGVFAIGLMVVFMVANTYLVDSYLLHAAAVTAANTALRSLGGALLPLAGPAMYDALGLGCGNSLLAFIALAMCACPVLFWKYGEMIRTHPRFQIRL